MQGIRSLLMAEQTSPPLPPPYDKGSGVTTSHFTRLRLVGKRLSLLCWRPSSQMRCSMVDCLVIGDSYADDVDMGFTCWPLLLAQGRGSCLNVARGGSRCAHAPEQLSRAEDFMAAFQLRPSEHSMVIVHLGGNDMLHALQLLGPFALLLLWLDMWHIGARILGLRPGLSTLPRVSFFGFLARRIVASLSALLALLARRGYTRVLVSGLPICSAMPLTRKVVSGLTFAWARPGGARFVTKVIDETADLLRTYLKTALHEVATTHGLKLVYFDEASALREVCLSRHAAAEQVGAGDAMWKDVHHPREWVHAELAAAVKKLLLADETGDAATRTKPTARRRLSRGR